MHDDVDIEIDDENASETGSVANSHSSDIAEDNRSNRLDKNFSADKLRTKASKLKVGDTEMHIGRIDYLKPSSMRSSRPGSNRSNTSQSSYYRQNDIPPNFYVQNDNLSDKNEMPDAIQEENERNMTKKSQRIPKIKISTIS